MASVADILGKKSSFQAIRQRLSHAWDETFSNIETESTDCIEAGDFLIDMAARSATVCGQELHLSRAELDVLVFLISHRKQVVTPHTMLATKFEGAGAVRGGVLAGAAIAPEKATRTCSRCSIHSNRGLDALRLPSYRIGNVEHRVRGQHERFAIGVSRCLLLLLLPWCWLLYVSLS